MTTGDDGVRFGVLLRTHRHPGQTATEVYARTLAVTERAEQLGIDDVWVTEHHFLDTALSPSALALAGFLLGRTRRIRVGTAVTLLPLHPPVHLAEQTALLDHLSGGRFLFGVGRGQPAVEYEAIGGGIGHWHQGLAEPLDLISAAWRGQVSAASDLHTFRPVRPVPTPLSRSGPPVYVAANSPATIKDAAVRGLPLLLFFDKNTEAKAEMTALHATFAAEAGRPADGHRHAFAVFAQVTDDPERAATLMYDRARHFLRTTGAHELLVDRPVPPPVPELITHVAEALLADHPVGDPATCVRRLVAAVRGSGCRRILCDVEAAGGTSEALDNLARLATEVFPEVRRELAATAGADGGTGTPETKGPP